MYKQYIFYLEKRDEATGIGPLLKYGHKGKPIKHVLDLSYRPVDSAVGYNGVIINKKSESRRKFKIITQEETLILKAENTQEREQWMQILF